ncbi:Signal recognition particle protein [Coemansia guatemalensis]|uniref:Signal recognition particle protein n=1 Tax=Coemansia guatemalensis TaxID=2761395 RepID=A0A9W8LSJ1_9FUNG|nr:Signal recognition particle protein [Coemansia guatemalensis]
MVYYDSWDAFEKAAADLFASAADKARYTIKYRNSDAALILKVTDDATCVQIRTEKLDDIKRIAHLHRQLAQSASHRAQAIKGLAPIFPKREEPEAQPAAKVKAGSGITKQPHQQQGRGKKKTHGRKRR